LELHHLVLTCSFKLSAFQFVIPGLGSSSLSFRPLLSKGIITFLLFLSFPSFPLHFSLSPLGLLPHCLLPFFILLLDLAQLHLVLNHGFNLLLLFRFDLLNGLEFLLKH
jgi:hypothetical protein